MDSILDYEIPAWHPVAVHFPVPLALVTLAAALFWATRPSKTAALVTVCCAASVMLSAIIAFLTGEELEETSENLPMVDLFGELHEDWGRIGMILSIALFVGATALAWMTSRRPRGNAWRWLVVTLSLALLVVLGWTAHVGGTMVWGVPR